MARYVLDLQELDLTQAAGNGGLLARERRGTWMFYRLVPERVEALRQAIALPAERTASKRSA